MGQQQLLLIVLSTIIVGISIAVGINMVTSNAAQSNFDAVMQDVITLGEKARAWYRKPVIQGGGGYSFADLSSTAQMDSLLGFAPSNENGDYVVSTAGNASQVTFQGTGREDGDGDTNPLQIQVIAYRDSLVTSVLNR